tara:strand:- start:12298 stop:12633 length:336 start_codon:yes stop_codon:yes gene_type:complete
MDGGVHANRTSGGNDPNVLLLPEYTPLVAAIAVMIAMCTAGVIGLAYLAIECLATRLVTNVFHGMGRPRKASETIGEEFEEEEEEDDQNEYTDAYDTRRETTFVGPTASQV